MGKRTDKIVGFMLMLSVAAMLVSAGLAVLCEERMVYMIDFATFLVCAASFILLYDRLG